MRVIIAGSRSISSYDQVATAVQNSGFEITEIVSGHARGPDRLGEWYGRQHNIPIRIFHPDWSIGPAAGPIRNTQMGEYADAAIIVWDGRSTGTKHMLSVMKKLRKPFHVHRVVIPDLVVEALTK